MRIPDSPHPTDLILCGYGLGTLDGGSAGAVDAHLEGCERCRERVNAISGAGLPAPDRARASETISYNEPKRAGWQEADDPEPGLADHPDYDLKRELGRGGMGVVYLARNKLMGRDEVLKVMGRHIIDHPGVFDRFLREIRAVARLRHENIVTAYSTARFGESIALAMEYVEGLDLSRMVRAKGPLPVAHACNFAYQVALGLQHAHEEGLVHRDIKPGNLMLTRKGKKATIKILDFGLAKVTREGTTAGDLTQEGQALGTPDYIAPEQVTGARSVDIRADIYSLGATLYFLLTGRPPFKASSPYAMFHAHISRDPEPLDLVRPEVPPELARIVARMMAKDPAARFQTPQEAAGALKPFFREGNAAFKGSGAMLAPAGESASKAMPTDRAEVPSTRTDTANSPTMPEVRWESLIEFHEDDDPDGPSPTSTGPTRRRAWVWPSIAVGLLMIGLVVWSFAIGLRVRTETGELVFDGLPDDAVVAVDGNVVEVDWPGSDGPARVSVAAGEHSVKVELKGVEVAGDVVKIKAGDRKWIRVRLAATVAPLPEKKPDVAEEPGPIEPSQPGTEVAATPSGPPAGPLTSPTATPTATVNADVLYVDTFDKSDGGWPQEDPNLVRKAGDSYHYGYANGVWFNSGADRRNGHKPVRIPPAPNPPSS